MAKEVREIRHRWIWLAAVAAVGALVDIGTKRLAVAKLEFATPVNVIGEYFQWLLVYNKGAVFGIRIDSMIPGLPTHVIFIAFMSAAIAFLLLYYKTLRKNEVLMHVGLMLVLPGAFGNLHDRIVYKDQGVVDFIRMGFPPDNYWFIYNVADIFVTAGVAVMILNFILEATRGGGREAASGENQNAGDADPAGSAGERSGAGEGTDGATA